jgi:hypothetical protein
MWIGVCMWAGRVAWVPRPPPRLALGTVARCAVGCAGADGSRGTGVEKFAQLDPGVSTGGTCSSGRESSTFRPGLGHEKATNLKTGALTLRSGRSIASERCPFAAFSRMARPGLEPGTPRFSVVSFPARIRPPAHRYAPGSHSGSRAEVRLSRTDSPRPSPRDTQGSVRRRSPSRNAEARFGPLRAPADVCSST